MNCTPTGGARERTWPCCFADCVNERAIPNLLHIGTSATMATEGKRDDRRRAVAAVATKLFGSEVKPENIVDETLRPAIQAEVPAGRRCATSCC